MCHASEFARFSSSRKVVTAGFRVNLGDDADTVGAVTGQIAGAIWGYTSIPNEWKERLAWRDRLIAAATALWELSITG